MQSPFANMPPVVKNLIIINIICWLPFLVFNESLQNLIYNYGSAHYFDAPLFKVWQPLTYMFLHDPNGFMHILFNMFALYSFGTLIEYNMGSKRFFNFYFICGLGGIALQMLVQAIEVHSLIGALTIDGAGADAIKSLSPEGYAKLESVYRSSMVGASGAIFGVLIAFGMLYPNMELMILFIPMPVKAKYIIPVYIVIEIWLGVARYSGDSVAHFAHLGGALIGFLLIKLWGLRRQDRY